MNQFIALRFDHLRFDDSSFDHAILQLQWTRYSLKSMSADAPWVTHCITAVRYVILQSTGFTLPYTYIGDFLGHMIHDGNQWARLIPLEDHDRWDLVFFHRRSPAHKTYMIAHVGIFTDAYWNYFHSSPKWGKIDNISYSLINGTIVACNLAMRRTDPRKSFT